jgi:hypothetical protein
MKKVIFLTYTENSGTEPALDLGATGQKKLGRDYLTKNTLNNFFFLSFGGTMAPASIPSSVSTEMLEFGSCVLVLIKLLNLPLLINLSF